MQIIRVEEIIGPVGTGICKPLFAKIGDTNIVLKTYNNIETNRILANELIGFKIAKILDLPIPEAGICVVDKTVTHRDNKQKLKYIKDILKSNQIEYSSKKIIGKYDENIQFDYTIDDYVFKMFTFENKRITNQIFSAKSWAHSAEKIRSRYKTIFIYDIEKENDPEYSKIMEILKESSVVIRNLFFAITTVIKTRLASETGGACHLTK